jgi:hypothetical protein
MTMAVHHCLPGRHTGIEPDIVPGRLEILLNHLFALIDQCKHSLLLLKRHRKKIRNMPEWDHEQVPRADRVAVPAGITEIVLCNDIICNGIAERAGHGRFPAPDPRISKQKLGSISLKIGRGNPMLNLPFGTGYRT